MPKTYFKTNVYDAAIERINTVFDHFERVCVAFSGGKDSTVTLHLALEVARKRGKTPVHAMLIDLEGQYKATIDHVFEMFSDPDIKPWWICLPINLRNACSVHHPYWCAWEPGGEWVRDMPQHPAVINDQSFFPWYQYRMEFEEFVPRFNEWLSKDIATAFLVGIRADESMNRYKAVRKSATIKKCAWNNIQWSSKFKKKDKSVSFYPIYDWRFEDIWKYIGEKNLSYNRLYDYMYLAGYPPVEMRICQPYGDDQRKGLDMFHKIEPETWFRIVQRVEGANWGAHYAKQKLMGYKSGLGLPPTFSTWQQYAEFMLHTMPPDWRAIYDRRIKVFLDWWAEHEYPTNQVPDKAKRRLEGKKKVPSWRRICMSIIKMDMGKSLSFGFCRKDTDRLIDIKNKYDNL